jgi:hypothetical protein
VATTFDSIGLVLCCRIISEYQKSLVEKNIPCLNEFYTSLLGLFWPRFDVIIKVSEQDGRCTVFAVFGDLHTVYGKSSDPRLSVPFVPAVGCVQMNRASIEAVNPAALTAVDTRPHYIVRRYAEFSGSLLSLNEGGRFEQVTAALRSLRDEVANFIMRVAAEFPNRREQLIFLINNYDMLLSVVNASTTSKV